MEAGDTKAAPKPKRGEKGESKGRMQRGVRIHVRNLAPSITTAQLQEMFAPCGNVIKAEVKLNDDQTSRGLGFVILPSMPEATKAVAEMNEKVVDGKALEVCLAPDIQGKDGDGKGKGDKGKGKGKEGKEDGKGKYHAFMMAQMARYPAYGWSPMAAYGAYDYPPAPYGYPPMFGAPYGYPYHAGMMPPEYYQAAFPGATSPIAMGQAAAEAALAAMPAAAPSQSPFFPPSVTTETQGKKGKGKGKGKKGKEEAPVPEVPAPPHGKVFTGTLKSLSTKNGYGFIECEEAYEMYKRDVYVDSEAVSENAKKGASLQFNITLSSKGRPQAANVVGLTLG